MVMEMRDMHNILMKCGQTIQFHNWVLVVVVIDFGGGLNFGVESIV
jgi:hypothetical protein